MRAALADMGHPSVFEPRDLSREVRENRGVGRTRKRRHGELYFFVTGVAGFVLLVGAPFALWFGLIWWLGAIGAAIAFPVTILLGGLLMSPRGGMRSDDW